MNRVKMSRGNRAKQFMPFAALTGHREVLAMREKVAVKKSELTEEMKEELNWKLQSISRGDMVTVLYFDENKYLKLSGMVSRIDVDRQILFVVNTPVSFDSIRNLEWEIFD